MTETNTQELVLYIKDGIVEQLPSLEQLPTLEEVSLFHTPIISSDFSVWKEAFANKSTMEQHLLQTEKSTLEAIILLHQTT